MCQKRRKNKFYVGTDENNFQAQMAFVPSGNNLIIIDHTEVSDELRGQNVGKTLVAAGVNYARETNLLWLFVVGFTVFPQQTNR